VLVSHAVRSRLARVHEEGHVRKAVAVVRVAATAEALVHKELDLLLNLVQEI
jgi:hypothetical protein